MFKKAQAAGYDGIIYYGTDLMNRGADPCYIFWKPTQAKLAEETTQGDQWYDYPVRIGSNRGTFSPDEADITKSDAEVIAEFLR